jgi:hypothetical protein
MGLVTRTMTTVSLSLSLLAGCTLHESYPPALPATTSARWENTPLVATTPPPPELAYVAPAPRKPPGLVPTDSEWSLWEPAPAVVCQGRGKARRCAPGTSPAVHQAQTQALIRPTRRSMGNGSSATITYDYQPGGIYLVEVAPHTGTILMLPAGQRLRIPPVLSKELFVVGTDDSPEDETVNDLLALRARQAPQRAVNVPLVFRSGLILTVRLVTVEGDPMTLVQWNLPEAPMQARELPIGDRPPKFDSGRIYAAYTMSVEGKDKLTPPWMPIAVADDGQNTVVKFARALDWTRSPVVVGMAQNGTPSITPSRYFTRQGAPEEGAVLFVYGLWPALVLKDSAGLTVKIVRTPPAESHGGRHAAHE